MTLVPGRDGYTTNVTGTVKRLQAAAFEPAGRLSPVVKISPPQVQNADIQPAVRQADQMVRRPFQLRSPTKAWTLEKAALTDLLRWSGKGADVEPYLAEGGLRARVREIAAQANTPPTDARIETTDAGARVAPDTDGVAVEVDKTVAAVRAAALEPQGVIALRTRSIPAAVQGAQLETAAARANRLIGQAVTVSLDGRTWTAGPATLRGWLQWEGTGAGVTPLLDHQAVHGFVDGIAAAVNIGATDAYIATEDGSVRLVSAVPGLAVDIEGTVAIVEDLATTNERIGEASVVRTTPSVTDEDLQHAYGEAARVADDRFTLRLGEQGWYLDPADLVRTLRYEGVGASTHAYVDASALQAQIKYWVALEDDTNIIIDYERTTEDALAALNSGSRSADITYAKKSTTVPSGRHNGNKAVWKGDFPEKWIDLNLATQSMAAYEDGKQVRVSLITSGRPELPTPTGVYNVLSKVSPKMFISPWPKDSKWYYEPVQANFALLFRSGGFYIHDAP